MKVIAILHGYYSSPLFMKGIEWEINSWDIFDQVLNLNLYGTTAGIFSPTYNINTPIIRISKKGKLSTQNTIVENIVIQLREKLDPNVKELYLLGHSMGGLVWRALIKVVNEKINASLVEEFLPRICGLIQLASPNQGSDLTNMKIVKILDKFHIILHYKLLGSTTQVIRKLIHKLGLGEEPSEQDQVPTTQIQQMTPHSDFLQWLNDPPTYVDTIPHFILIGTQNNFFFTNLAWLENHEKLDQNNIINKLKEELPQNYLDESKVSPWTRGSFFGDFEDLKDYSEVTDTGKDNLFGEVKKLLTSEGISPNDGMVSLENASLPGAEMVDLTPYTSKISHVGICLWYLPFKPYKFVRDQVKKICERLVVKGSDQTV